MVAGTLDEDFARAALDRPGPTATSVRTSASTDAISDRYQIVIALTVLDDRTRAAGEIKAVLKRQGTPIGPNDILIAGQARARGLTVVTRNVGEFRRVEGLQVEEWAA